MVIIVSSATDAHIPFVAQHLHRPPVIIDVATILRKEGLSYVITGERSQVLYRGKTLSDITGVWVRRPSIIPDEIQLPVRPQDQRYCASALQTHLEQLYVHFPNATWVSDWFALQRAKQKTLQLRVAADLGLTIPDTIITSSPQDAERFVKKHGAVVIKPLSSAFPLAGKVVYPFLTHKIPADEPIDYKGLHLGPVFFQEAIDHVSDIRVTVVDKKVFATKIVETAPQKDKVRDWRASLRVDGGLVYTPFDLPSQIEHACVRLVKALGLRFGAIDFVEDVKGHFYFLEINTNGQWAFIEQATGQQIGKAIAALLETRTV